MLATLAFLGFIAVAGILFLRMLKAREEHQMGGDTSLRIKRPKRMTARERKLAKIKEFEESLPPRPTIQELMAEEVRETGVDRIPGGEGLEIPVRLKVWHRDEHVRAGCADGALRFVVGEGIDPAIATEADVMLVCDAIVETADAGAPASVVEPPDDDPAVDPGEAESHAEDPAAGPSA